MKTPTKEQIRDLQAHLWWLSEQCIAVVITEWEKIRS